MLHHPTKYHTNALTHFLNLHTAAVASTQSSSPPNLVAANLINSNNLSSGGQNIHQLQSQTHTSSAYSSHSPIDYNGVCGGGSSGGLSPKSFTIASILGLNNNSGDSRNRNFSEVVNLSLGHHHQHHPQHHQSGPHASKMLLDNFDRVPPHLYDGGTTASPKTPFNSGFNNHHPAASPASALQNLQQLHQQHINATAVGSFVSREKYKSVLEHSVAKKSSMKSKRVRTIFTPEQLERLEAEFERQQYMVGPERLYLAHTLQLTEAQVKVWFQNRRIKWRKHHLEVTQQRLALIRQRQLAGSGAPTASSTSISEGGGKEADCEEHMAPDSPDLTVCSDSVDASDVD